MGGVGKVFGVGGSLSVGRCGPDDMMGGGDILPVDVAAQPTTTPEGARTTSTFGERWASARTRIQPQLPCHLPGQLVRLPDPLIPPRTLDTRAPSVSTVTVTGQSEYESRDQRG